MQRNYDDTSYTVFGPVIGDVMTMWDKGVFYRMMDETRRYPVKRWHMDYSHAVALFRISTPWGPPTQPPIFGSDFYFLGIPIFFEIRDSIDLRVVGK